jgi:hypothetical protein
MSTCAGSGLLSLSAVSVLRDHTLRRVDPRAAPRQIEDTARHLRDLISSGISNGEMPDVTAVDGAELTGKCAAVLHAIGDSRTGALEFALSLKHGYGASAPASHGHGESGGEIVADGTFALGLNAWSWLQRGGWPGVIARAAILLETAGIKPSFRATGLGP